MSNGGIFSAANALGLGAFQPLNCSTQNKTLVAQMQKHLKANGAPGLRVDNVWGPCSASAFRNVYGRPVSVADLEKVAGRPCTSGVLLGGTTDFMLPLLGTCQDGSDSASGGGGGQSKECPSGYMWVDLLGTCVPSFGADGGNEGKQPVDQACPQGQVRVGGVCLPDINQILNPNGGGGATPAQEGCPEGQVGIPPFCVPNPFAKKDGGGQTQPQSSTCPEGQFGIPPFCVPNPFAGGADQTQPGTWPLPALCPPGQTFNLPSLSCQGGGQPTTPAACPEGYKFNASGQCEPAGTLSTASMGLWAAVGLLAAGGIYWAVTRNKSEIETDEDDVSTQALIDILSGPSESKARANRRRRR